jgi:delta24(24(1))-sterol reductase
VIPTTRSDESDAPDSTGAEDNTIEVDSKKKTNRRKSTKVAAYLEENTGANGYANGNANGHANGIVKGQAKETPRVIDGWVVGSDPRIDSSGHFEFGGSWGTGAMMIGFPLLMYYMWIGATYYGGHFPTRTKGQSYGQLLNHFRHLVYTGAYPSVKAWMIYWFFFVAEGTLYCLAPGVWTKGKPLAHSGGIKLDYYCSGLWSWYTTILVAVVCHVTGVFKLDTIVDEYGPLMSVAIISGFMVSIIAYLSALYRGKEHRMTGSHVYDFFMGAELNPRMFGILDFKMFFEVRLPWFMLFLFTLGACARQYELYGYVSGNLGLLTLAFFLYANACAKAEECIVPTWDMYHEKWGFMLIFWNLAGVPFTYCHCILYAANHPPQVYEWNRYAMTALFVTYLFVYWIWDTTNSQKNRFRAREHGGFVDRKAFPQLPWQTVENPRVIHAANGGTILADGWCK